MRKKKDIKKIKNIGTERINILMSLAEKEYKNNRLDRVERYIQLSKNISMKLRIPFPKEWKRRICKYCNSFLVYGENARVRIRKDKYSYIGITCLECGNTYRIPLIKEKKEKRRKKKEENIKK